MSSKSLALLFTAPLLTLASLSSQSWTQLMPATAPDIQGPRLMVYHTQNKQITMFGRSGSRLDQVTTWDGTDWTTTTLSSANASVWYTGSRVAYHSTANTVLRTGGVDITGVLNALWFFDGAKWTKASRGPGPRANSAMAYDSDRQKIVMFGGATLVGPLDDTRESDGADFSLVNPAQKPPARANHVMVYDPVRKVVVLFGGCETPTMILNDTWEYDGNDWVQIMTPTSPLGRDGAAAAYDPDRGTVVMYGGSNKGTLTDTWEYDGTNWTEITSNPAPMISGPGMAYDEERKTLLLTGGNPTVETWVLSSPVVASYEQFGMGCAGTAGVPMLDAASGSLPKVNNTFTLELTNLPMGNGTAFVTFGFSKTEWAGMPLPADLTPLGLWGCTVYASIFAAFGVSTAGGGATFDLAIPADPSLVGLPFFNQGLVLDPVNPVGAIVTNAGEGVIGPQ